MRSLLEFIRTLRTHYKLFGYDGIRFYYQKKWNKNGVINVSIPGFSQPVYLRNSTEDMPMFDLIFHAQDYEFKCDFNPEIILDCGAHIGLAAVFFANKYPNAKIICIEPEVSNFQFLVKNTSKYPNIQCVHGGIWNKPANLKVIDAGSGNWGFITEESEAEAGITIPALSVPQIMTKFDLDHIDICKINVEGTEKELFEKNYQNWIPKTRLILIELHDHIRAGCSKSFFKALVNYEFSLSNQGLYLLARILS